MSDTGKQYRAITGFIQFDPKDGTAGGKSVRNIAIRQTGILDKEAGRVSCTLWPNHAHVKVDRGDLVAVEGEYRLNNGFHNLSVKRIVVLGKADEGTGPETTNAAGAEPEADDDIPF